MNSRQRVQAVIDGQIPDRVPVCLHNFMAAAREAGITMSQYRTDPDAVVHRAVKEAGAHFSVTCLEGKSYPPGPVGRQLHACLHAETDRG